MIAVDLMIDNADVKAAGNATFERLNPMTGEVAARAAASSAEDAVRAADAAAAAFPAWSEMAPAARRALLNKAADLIEAAGAKFAPVMGAETGSTAMWAGFNCMLAAGMVRESPLLVATLQEFAAGRLRADCGRILDASGAEAEAADLTHEVDALVSGMA